MAITPIETAAFLPKSQEASFQRQTEVQKPANEQIVLNSSMKEQEMRDSTKTMMAEKPDQPEYRYDGSSGNGKGMLYQRQGQKKKKKPRTGSSGPVSGIDIRI